MDPPSNSPAFALPPWSSLSSSSSPTSVTAAIDRNPQDIDSKCGTDSSSGGSNGHDDGADHDECASVDLDNDEHGHGRGGMSKPAHHQLRPNDPDGYSGNDLDLEKGSTGGGGRLPKEFGRTDPGSSDDDFNDDTASGGSREGKRVDEEEGGGAEEEDGPARRTIAFWLLAWLLNNVALTLLNKATFAKFDFSYPFFLSFFHMACNYVGAEVWFTVLDCQKKRNAAGLIRRHDSKYHAVHGYKRSKSVLMDNMERATLDASGLIKTYAFSVIFSLNIAIGNVSLRYVSVNFNQVMRSLVPAVAIAFGACMGKDTSMRRKLAVVPVVLGVAMACFGDFSITTIGFVFTCLCVVLAALKAVAAGEILTGELKLHPVDLLYKMAPKAAVQCLLLSLATGEIRSIASRWSTELSPSVSLWPLFGVVSTGILSFSLNISSLISNKLTSPLTLCIAANVKQVLMIVLATIMFKIEISPLNGSGILVVLVGSAIYSFISMQEKTGGNKACVDSSEKRTSNAKGTEDLSVSSEEEEEVALIDARR